MTATANKGQVIIYLERTKPEIKMMAPKVIRKAAFSLYTAMTLLLAACAEAVQTPGTPTQAETAAPRNLSSPPVELPTPTMTPGPKGELETYYGTPPPAAALIAGGQEQEGAVGTYTWILKREGEEITEVHADALGLVTPVEPLVASSPFTATLRLPISLAPSTLWYSASPASEEQRWKSITQGPTYTWQGTGLQDVSLPLASEQEIAFTLEPGPHILEVYAEWRDLGSVHYGFYLEVLPGEAGGKTYTDPQGQFRLRLPAGWEALEKEGDFRGEDGSLRVRYLPELAYVHPVYRVCEQIAKERGKPGYQAVLSPLPQADACLLTHLPEEGGSTVTLVVENPGGDPGQRYLYLETELEHLETISASLELLNLPAEPVVFPYPSGQLRAEDEEFWGRTFVLPEELTVEEYPVVESSADSPSHFEFKDRFPNAVLKKRAAWRNGSQTRRLEAANALLAPFGFLLQEEEEAWPELYTLYRGGDILLEDISEYWPVSVSASGSDFALVVNVQDQGYRLARREALEEWDMWASQFIPPVFSGEKLLRVVWDGELSQVQVYQGDEQVFAFAAVNSVAPPVKGFWSWNGSWLLEVDGFLIQDGENLNATLGYDEIFGWQLLNGGPFYYFRKGPRIGISYSGRVLPVYYEEIPHYRCCEPAAFNNGGNEDMAWFYGLREGMWHYVEIGAYGE